MHTNVLAAMRLMPLVAPLLSRTRGTLAFISSRMGSIAEASASYGMLYRASKAAVNMVGKLAHTDSRAAGRPGDHPASRAGCAPTWAGRTPTSTSTPAWPACAA